MVKLQSFILAAILAGSVLVPTASHAQDKALQGRPALQGGVFVTPIRGAPFSAVVEEDMRQILKDGTSFQRKTEASIARDSAGRIRNERRKIVPGTEKTTPVIISIHFYDPATQMSTLLNLNTHLAFQRKLLQAPETEPPVMSWLRLYSTHPPDPNIKIRDLGVSLMEGRDVHGYFVSRDFPAAQSGTSFGIVATDEYWYDENLRINVFTRHNDPRTGQSLMTVTKINATEPDATLFDIPPGFKSVDATPPEDEESKDVRVEQ